MSYWEYADGDACAGSDGTTVMVAFWADGASTWSTCENMPVATFEAICRSFLEHIASHDG